MNKSKINIQQVLNISLIVYFFVYLVLLSNSLLAGEDDLFWYLSTGRYIIQTVSVPSADVFGFTTSGNPWIPFEWGWDVINYLLFSAGGYAAIGIFCTVIIALIFFMLYRMMLKFGSSYTTSAFFLVLLSLGLVQRLSYKPHIASYLFFVLLITIIVKYRYFDRNNHRILFFVPLIFLVWANVHMSALSGLALFAIYLFSEAVGALFQKKLSSPDIKPLDKIQLLRLFVILIVSSLVLLINPHGIRTYGYAVQIMSLKQLEVIAEWVSPFKKEYLFQFHNIIYYVFIISVSPLAYYSIRKKDFFPVLLFIGFLFQSTKAYRFTDDFMIVTVLFFAVSAGFILKNFRQKKADTVSLVPVISMSIVLIFLITIIPNNRLYSWMKSPRKFGIGIDENNFPVKMYGFIKENNIAEIGSRPFTTYETGGFFVWNFPGKKNFIGSRSMNDQIWNDYKTILNEDYGYSDLIDNYKFDYFIWMIPFVNYSANPIFLDLGAVSYLFQMRELWKLVYWDDRSFLFVKNDPKFSDVISKYEYKYVTPYNTYFNKNIIEKGLKEDPELVKKELDRKQKEDPNGVFLKKFMELFGSRVK